jgi:CRISPR system Cascade subunit CasC
MTTFVEFHALRSFPPSNLNRDDLGTPKTAVFGGSRRLRISSQCLKRTWRTSEHFRGAFAEEQLGVRTNRLPNEVLQLLGSEFTDAARVGLLALLTSIGKKEKKANKEKEDGEEVSNDEDGAGEDAAEPGAADAADAGATTVHLLFLSRQEVEQVAAFARKNQEALGKVITKKKTIDPDGMKKLRVTLKRHLEEHTSSNAVDIGLFGRFVTSDEIDTVEGALQVAHALGTQKVEVEYDFFTAVDDLGNKAEAGHLGETEFASSVLYLYACCDLDQLKKNLGARGATGRVADDEASKLACRSLPALVRALAESTPRGKRTCTAPHTPAEFIEIVVRHGAPMSYANAFTKPVDAREAHGDVMDASIARLAKHRARVEHAYGRDTDVRARFVLCLRDVEGALPDKGQEVETVDALSRGLAETLGVDCK